jgi:hypothetical protein
MSSHVNACMNSAARLMSKFMALQGNIGAFSYLFTRGWAEECRGKEREFFHSFFEVRRVLVAGLPWAPLAVPCAKCVCGGEVGASRGMLHRHNPATASCFGL